MSRDGPFNFCGGGRGGWVGMQLPKKNLQKKFKRKKNRAQESTCKKISKKALRARWICNFILFVGFTSETDTSRQTFPNLLII